VHGQGPDRQQPIQPIRGRQLRGFELKTATLKVREHRLDCPATAVIADRRPIRRVLQGDNPGFGVPRLLQNPQVRRYAVVEQPDIPQRPLGMACGEFTGGGTIANARIDGQIPFQSQPVMPIRLRSHSNKSTDG
jgi:hypothetical protein